MKLKVYLSAIFFLFLLKGNAQINILNTDMPQVNDALRYSTNSSKFDYTSTGANYVWDFTNLIPEHQDVQKFASPLSTPYLLQFLSNASYGLPESSQGLGPIGAVASNMYSFFKTSSSAQVLVGRGATIQSIPLGIVYAPKDTVYKYPMTYGKSFSGSFYGEQSLASLGSLKQAGTRQTNVDGWGTIKTPYGNFDCIRIKTIVNETDSIIFNGIGIPLPNNRITYTWLAKSEKFPILEVVVNSLTNIVTSIKYKDIFRPEAYVNNANFSANRTTTKVGDTITFTNSSFGIPKTYNWQINPSTFIFATGSNAGSENPKVIFTQGGKYSVKLIVSYEGASDDTLRSNYIQVNSTGLNQIENIEFATIFPNPGKNFIQVNLQKSSATEIKILDNCGRVVWHETIDNNVNTRISTDEYSRGIYFVQVKQGDNFLSKKIILE